MQLTAEFNGSLARSGAGIYPVFKGLMPGEPRVLNPFGRQ